MSPGGLCAVDPFQAHVRPCGAASWFKALRAGVREMRLGVFICAKVRGDACAFEPHPADVADESGS